MSTEKITKPSREPDIVHRWGNERLEIWLDEMIDCYTEFMDCPEEDFSICRIRFTDSGDCEFSSLSGDKKWHTYSSIPFPTEINDKIHTWIEEKILLEA